MFKIISYTSLRIFFVLETKHLHVFRLLQDIFSRRILKASSRFLVDWSARLELAKFKTKLSCIEDNVKDSSKEFSRDSNAYLVEVAR